jgi:hypothetical protein
MMTTSRLAASIGVFSSWVTCLSGQEPTKPDQAIPYLTATPKLERIVVEQSYYFTRAEYRPPVQVSSVARVASSAATPEDSVVALISSMRAGDFEWFRSLWTPESRKMMEDRDKKLGRGPGFWVDKWREVVQGKQAILTHRIRTGEYVLIAYKLVAAPPSGAQPPKEEEAFTSTAALRKVDGKWSLTQELASDPVASYWPNPETPIKLMGREPPK